MKIKEIELSEEEIELILEHQMCALESDHWGEICVDIRQCPPEHLDELARAEVGTRQQLIKKLEGDQ